MNIPPFLSRKVGEEQALLERQTLLALGSKHTETTVKVAVWAAIFLTAIPLVTLPLSLAIYLGYEQYLKNRAIKIKNIEENNLRWIQKKYFSHIEAGEQLARVVLAKLKLQNALKAHHFITQTSPVQVEKLALFSSLLSKNLLNPEDQEAVSVFFHSNEVKLPCWAEFLIHFTLLSSTTSPEEQKILEDSFKKFYSTFSPLSQSETPEKETLIRLFSLLLTRSAKHSVECIKILENHTEEADKWQHLFIHYSFAPQALLELRGKDFSIDTVKGKAQEIGKTHLQDYLQKVYKDFASHIEQYLAEHHPSIALGMLSIEESAFSSLSFGELAEKMFPENSESLSSLIKKELLANEKLEIKKKELEQLEEAAQALHQKHPERGKLINAKIIAYMFYSENRPAQNILNYMKANRTRFAYSETKEAETAATLFVIERQKAKESVPPTSYTEPSEFSEEDRKEALREDQRNFYWLSMTLLPTILSYSKTAENEEKRLSLEQMFPLPYAGEDPATFENYRNSLHMGVGFRKKIDSAKNILIQSNFAEEISRKIGHILQESTNSQDVQSDLSFPFYNALSLSNQIAFSSLFSQVGKIRCNDQEGNYNSEMTNSTRWLVERLLTTTAQLIAAKTKTEETAFTPYREAAAILHRISSFGSVTTMKWAVRTYKKLWAPLRHTINKRLLQPLLDILLVPEVKGHLAKNENAMIEAIIDAVPSLCDELQVEEILNRIKKYDQALSQQDFKKAANTVLELAQFLIEAPQFTDLLSGCMDRLIQSSPRSASNRSEASSIDESILTVRE